LVKLVFRSYAEVSEAKEKVEVSEAKEKVLPRAPRTTPRILEGAPFIETRVGLAEHLRVKPWSE
jgi:hypothetical protein